MIGKGKEPQRPAGGYVLVRIDDVCRVWAAYRTRRIRLIDVRVWFACHEMVARRCTLADRRSPNFSHDEIHRLVGGVGGEHVRHALSRLRDAALLRFSTTQIDTTTTLAAEAIATQAAAMLALIPNAKRLLPIPRRLLRLCAGGVRQAVLATTLGHLLRCVYIRNRAFNSTGACKSSWVARVFGVDERTVKSARSHLVELGVLARECSEQWYQNRFGGRVTVNLAWSPHRAGEGRPAMSTTGSSHPTRPSTTGTPPPESDKPLPSEYKNQKPHRDEIAGCRGRGKFAEEKAPTLHALTAADLVRPPRLAALFRQAVSARLVEDSEHAQLQFFAAAVHARVVGSRNPAGLFAILVRKGLWHFATIADEDVARRCLRDLSGVASTRCNTRPVTSVKAGGALCRVGSLLDGVLARTGG
jgi:hypothetical protein